MSKLKAKTPVLEGRGKAKIVVFGIYGVGKTTASLDFPQCYYIDTEGGARGDDYRIKLINSGGVYMGPEDGAGDLTEIIGQIKALATEKHDHKTLIIDSITKPIDTLIGFEQERLGDKDQFGASKKPAVSKLRQLMAWLTRIDMNVILIAHAKDKWENDKNVGKTFDIANDKIGYDLDLLLEIQKQGPQRLMRVHKTRYKEFEENRSYPWSYDSFANLYGRENIEGAVKVIELAEPETVSEINRLVALLKIPAETQEKWLDKAKAESFAEFSKDQATKTLEYLSAQLKGAAA